jgi:hypothetical protein
MLSEVKFGWHHQNHRKGLIIEKAIYIFACRLRVLVVQNSNGG